MFLEGWLLVVLLMTASDQWESLRYYPKPELVQFSPMQTRWRFSFQSATAPFRMDMTLWLAMQPNTLKNIKNSLQIHAQCLYNAKQSLPLVGVT